MCTCNNSDWCRKPIKIRAIRFLLAVRRLVRACARHLSAHVCVRVFDKANGALAVFAIPKSIIKQIIISILNTILKSNLFIFIDIGDRISFFHLYYVRRNALKMQPPQHTRAFQNKCQNTSRIYIGFFLSQLGNWLKRRFGFSFFGWYFLCQFQLQWSESPMDLSVFKINSTRTFVWKASWSVEIT